MRRALSIAAGVAGGILIAATAIAGVGVLVAEKVRRDTWEAFGAGWPNRKADK